MADSREVYAWPEMSLFAWTGTGSAIAAYVEDVQLQVSRSITKLLDMTTAVGYADRTKYVETNKEVTLTIGAMYAGLSFYGMLASGANISANIYFSAPADGVTSTFILWSAQMPDYNLQGSEGTVWKQKTKIIAPDISGV